jgi:hypothetical protein
MSDHEKLQAVEDYLRSEFPDAKIEVKYNAAERTHRFHILHQGKVHIALVMEAFLQGCATAEIAGTLKSFTLAEHLRELGVTPVVVTLEGLKLEGD